ncbi:hypothetical protein [Nonomuraea lactucae]|uniref:aromatic-ring hydroxylase C-terminal domain-containing protein n=1 Tax=Nonomuraea lactucae TaxID=2249762 RepID=UPI000DE52A63
MPPTPGRRGAPRRLPAPARLGRYGVTSSGAVLVRPDGVVAWRAPATTTSSEHEIEKVFRQILARGDQS